MDTIDTILPGAVTYKLFVDFWPVATTGTENLQEYQTLPALKHSHNDK
jgi:hypothetical protein